MNTEPPLDRFGRDDLPDMGRPWWRVLVPGRKLGWSSGGLGLLGVVCTLLVLAVFVLPSRLVERPSELDRLTSTERVQGEVSLDQARNAVRGTLVQAVGGFLVLLTFGVGFGQLAIARRGQLVDRFTKSIEQLGKEIDVRLGGIFALRQIAEHPDYARPVAEILLAYLKTHATDAAADHDSERSADAASVVAGSNSAGQRLRLRPDLQAALRVLVADGLWARATSSRLDLSFIDVRYADLRGVDLSSVVLLGAVLDGSNLEGATLRHADLRDASFHQSDLRRADLTGADLTRAVFAGARLDNARLREALLVDGNFRNASLRRADLTLTDATGARMSHAVLNGARLDKAVLRGADLRGSDLTGATMTGIQFDRQTVFDEAILDDVVRDKEGLA